MICLKTFVSLCIATQIVSSEAFQPIPSFSPKLSHHVLQSTVTETTVDKTATSKKPKKGVVQVIFIGKKKISSKPISLSSLKSKNISIQEFFLSPQNRNLILGKPGSVQPLPSPSIQNMKAWGAESKGFVIDTSTDVSKDDTCDVVKIETDGMKFPGMTLKSVTTIGCKLILPPNYEKGENEGDFLDMKYEFTLLDSELQPEGSKPTVWLFKKLTNAGGKGGKDDGQQANTSSFTSFSIDSTSNPDEIVLTSDATLQVRVEFPSFLVRLIPVSIEKMEEQGSHAMQSTIEKELSPALDRFVAALTSS